MIIDVIVNVLAFIFMAVVGFIMPRVTMVLCISAIVLNGSEIQPPVAGGIFGIMIRDIIQLLKEANE